MSRTPEQRDWSAAYRLAWEILEQIGHRDRHEAAGTEDGARCLVLAQQAEQLAAVAGRMARRWRRARGER